MTENLNPLRVDNLVVELTKTPTDLSTTSSNQHTDHILEVDWNSSTGWGIPHIKPWQPIALEPNASVLHYSTTCYEGLKAYRSNDGLKVRTFRPYLNMVRLNDSADRLCLPNFDPDVGVALLDELLKVEKRFIRPGGFIYVRPLMFGTENNLGLKPPNSAKLIFMTSLFPSFDAKPIKVYSSPPSSIRAWPGGFGNKKLGANYGPAIYAHRDALKAGYNQVLWLNETGVVTEAGTSNFFVAIKTRDGKDEVLTCPLTGGLILPGITRLSILELLTQAFPDANVQEREFTIREIEAAYNEGRLIEAFAVGTAYFVSSVKTIRTPEGIELELLHEQGVNGRYSGYAKRILSEIMWGNSDHVWTHSIE